MGLAGMLGTGHQMVWRGRRPGDGLMDWWITGLMHTGAWLGRAPGIRRLSSYHITSCVLHTDSFLLFVQRTLARVLGTKFGLGNAARKAPKTGTVLPNAGEENF